MGKINPKMSDAGPPGRIHDLRTTVAGCQPEKRNWIRSSFAPHAVGLVVQGNGSYQVEDGPVQRIGPGSVFYVYPGPRFFYGPDQGTTWSEYHVGGIGPGVERWRRYGWMQTDGRVRQIEMDQCDALVNAFHELFELRASGKPGDRDRMLLMTEKILLELSYATGPVDTGDHDDAISQAIGYLQKHFHEPLDFDEVAEQHCMSYSLLRQQIKARTGLSPAKYVTHLRCNAACELLTNTTLPIKTIATRVGYVDSPTFSKAFQRTVSVWPRAFREGQRGLVG